MSDRAESVLELSGVHKCYGSFVAVERLDLQLGRGEILGFVGPNGAGKTTTLRLITGLLRATSGRIQVCGFDVERQPLEAKRRIGFISDRPFVYDKLTGSEFLRFVGGLWSLSARQIEGRAQSWLEHFELSAWSGEPIDAYSHGMRQRLLLCAALLHQPELLIMDEPMVGLDPRGAMLLKQTLAVLAHQQGMTVILSTHTLDVVEQVCDRVAILDRGRLIAAGTLAELQRAHQVEQGRLEELFLRLTEGSDGARLAMNTET